MPASATISSEPRVYANEIAEALAAGDTTRLAALAFELAVKLETNTAVAEREREVASVRREYERERKAEYRRRKHEESLLSQNVPGTSRDNTGQDGTPSSPLDGPLSPPLALSPLSPPYNPPSSPENGALKRKPRDALKPPRPDEPDGFADAMQALPPRSGTNSRRDAMRAYSARLAEGVASAALVAGARRYHAWAEATGKIGTELVMQAARFFGPSRQWENEWALPKPPPKPARVETDEEVESRLRNMSIAVSGRRALNDGDEWWERMQREANTSNARMQLQYAFAHVHERRMES